MSGYIISNEKTYVYDTIDNPTCDVREERGLHSEKLNWTGEDEMERGKRTGEEGEGSKIDER